MTKNEASLLRQRCRILCNEVARMQEEILSILSRKQLLKGSIYRKYKTCSKKGCKCMKGQRHGPFLYLSGKIHGKSKLLCIRKSMEYQVEDLARYYRRWRTLRAGIVRYYQEMVRCIDRLERSCTTSYEEVLLKDESRKKR